MTATKDYGVDLYPEEIRAARPPSSLTVSEWCEAHIHIVKGPQPGPMRFDVGPHIRQPVDMLAAPSVRSMTLMMPSQTFKTTVLRCAHWWWHSESPDGDCLWVMPNHTDARDFNVDDLQAMGKASPRLQHLFSHRKHDSRATAFTGTNGMTTHFAGSNSPQQLASKTCRRVVFDEPGKFAPFVGREADAVNLGRSRYKTFIDFFEILASTPVDETDHVWTAWKQSDQREYHAQCLECGWWQQLVITQVEGPEKATPEELERDLPCVYLCSRCGHAHDETQRVEMLANPCLWVPKGAELDDDGIVDEEPEPVRIGYHMSQLGVIGTPMSRVLAKFKQSRGNMAAEQDFENSWNGWIFSPEVKTVDVGDGLAAAVTRDYEPRRLPEDVHFVVATVDIQGDELGYWYLIRGYGPRRSYLIDYGSTPADFDALDRVLSAWLPRGPGGSDKVPITTVLVDSGYRANDVYSFCRPRAGRLYEAIPTKGSSTMRKGIPFQWSTVDKGAGVRLCNVNVNYFADTLSDTMQAAVDGDYADVWTCHRDTGRDYFAHLQAEKKIRDRKTGKLRWVLRGAHRRNELLDCERLQLVAAHYLNWWALDPATPKPEYDQHEPAAVPPQVERATDVDDEFEIRKRHNPMLRDDADAPHSSKSRRRRRWVDA